MLKEDEVLDFASAWLEQHGFIINAKQKGTAKGHDIEAVDKNGRPVWIECKGSGYSKPFSTNGQWSRLSGAVFNQVRLNQENPDAMVGLALPKNSEYENMLFPLKKLLKQLDIFVLWIEDNGAISAWH